MKENQQISSAVAGQIAASDWRKVIFSGLLLFGLVWTSFAGSVPVYVNDSGDPEVLKDWSRLEESATLVDVSYKVVRCSAGGPASVLLQIFNEGGMVSNIGFSLSITDLTTGSVTSHSIQSVAAPFAQIITGTCDGADQPLLKFDLPSGFDGANVSIVISYI